MPDNNNNVSNENVSAYIWPTDNVITDLKFGANEKYEIGIGKTTQEFLENIFGDIDENFGILDTTIEENEETISNALNDLNDRKADKADIPVVPTNVSAFTNDAGYLTQHQDISAYFNDVEYDSVSKRINFKNGATVKKYIDAADFIKDGMVDSVTVGNVTIDEELTKCLIITFNTDSGKEDINIPLSNIFDSNEYYTKEEIDEDGKVIASSLVDLDERKLDASEISNYYTKTESDAKYLTEDSASENYYGKDYIDELERVTANSLTDLDTNKADKTDIPTNVSSLTNDAGYLVSSDISGKADKTPIVNHGTSDTTFELTPNVYHQWGEVASLTLTLGSAASGYLAEYMFEFTSGSTATTLSLPAAIKWQMPLSVEANKIYQVSIVNNIGIIIGVNS